MIVNSTLKKLLLLAAGVMLSAQAYAALNIQKWQTSKGTEVYFVENHDLPIIDISTNFAAGSARDTAKPGLSGITRYMLTLGAAGMTDEQISNSFADVGAVLGGELDADRAGLKLRTLSSAREQAAALDTYIKILHQPDFPEATLKREKARIIAGLKEAATQPASISNKAFLKALYGTHPYAVDDEGEPEAVNAITRTDLQQFYQQYYGAKNAVIALMGDMTPEQAKQIAERISAGLPDSPAAAALPTVSYPSAAVEKRIPHPASQSHILLGYPGVKRGDDDYFALYVGNYILGGGGFVSRLTEEVREKRGLVYSVYSYFIPMQELGQFQVGLQTKRDQAEDALKLVRETLATFISKGVTEAELKAAKQNIIGGFPMRIDSNSKILDYLAVIGFYHLPLTYLDEFNGKVEQVTAAQIKDAFSRRIDPNKMVTVVVGGSK
ncbi:insulinase family protein [Methylobacillus gramineus]|uniref:M16 family metallopeptidase n=1 Tax=Methylobacillus gramineus TaxID=755169 RepID=UPI001CFF6B28|nr:pitrilysin family protein [Methylobacillus gramineus]MCB5184931.1 insulinase family protein [Methylobacillus gramineus]